MKCVNTVEMLLMCSDERLLLYVSADAWTYFLNNSTSFFSPEVHVFIVFFYMSEHIVSFLQPPCSCLQKRMHCYKMQVEVWKPGQIVAFNQVKWFQHFSQSQLNCNTHECLESWMYSLTYFNHKFQLNFKKFNWILW